MFKPCQSHFSLCNFDHGLRFFCSFFGSQRPSLLRHDRTSVDQTLNFLLIDYLDIFKVRQIRHSQTMRLFNSFYECGVINLLVKRGIVATFSINIVSQHILAVVDPANCRIGVGTAIWVECWLAKVCCECWIGKPPRCIIELRLPLVHLLLVLNLCWSEFWLFWLYRLAFYRGFARVMRRMVVWLHIWHIFLEYFDLFLLLWLTFCFIHCLLNRSLFF